MKTLLSMVAVLVLMGKAADAMAQDFVVEGDCYEGGGNKAYDYNANIPICKGGKYDGKRLANEYDLRTIPDPEGSESYGDGDCGTEENPC